MKHLTLTKPAIVNIIVLMYMTLFFYAAIYKLFDYQVFVVQIGRSPLIMYYANFLAWFVPTMEIVAALLLFIPSTRLVGLFLSFSIMFGFSVYIFFMLTFSPYVPCSCGGILNSMGWTEHLIFNIVFTLLAIVAIGLHTRINKQTPKIAIV